MPWHGRQHSGVLGVAEKLVHGLFGLTQGHAEFANHAAHGLVVADPAVQLFHPLFERFGLGTCRDRVQTLCETAGAGFHLFVRRIQLFKSRLQIQHRGGHFHGQRGRWRLTRSGGGIKGTRQRLRQVLTAGVELAQRIAHQTELVCGWLELVAVASRQGGPGFRGRSNALARLGQHRRVKTAKACRFVVHRLEPVQRKSLANRPQRRRRIIRQICHPCLRAEEQQVLHQPVGNRWIALGQGGVLHEHTGRHALHVHIRRQKARAKGVEEARADFPERARLPVRLGSHKAQAGVAQAEGGLQITRLDDAQHCSIQPRTRLGTIRQRRQRHRAFRLAETAFHRPQVCGVNTISTRQGLGIAVLRKQRHRRHGFAGQHGFQVFDQRKTGTLDDGGSVIAAGLGALHKLLHRRFHGPQHQRRRTHAHHFQRAAGLVQLLARNAQGASVQRRQIGLACYLGITHKAPHRLDSTVQRFAQLVKHPSQRTQVLISLGPVGGRCIVDINR